MKIEKIGMRTIKTAIAASLTILISQLFNFRSPFFAGIAAIIAMQSSVSESFSSAKNRMYGTIVGAIIALLFSLIAPENPFFIGIGIIIIIYTCNIFGWKKSVQISTIVFLSIILNYEEGSRVSYAFYRTVDTLFGLIIGTLINYFILPPNMEGKIRESLSKIYSQVKDMLECIIWKEENVELEGLRKDLVNIEGNYNILKKEIKFNLCKTNNCFDYHHVFEIFENIYSHLSIITAIEKSPYIDEINRKSLEKLFNREIPSQLDQNKDDLDLVYNYHLEKILNKLALISNVLATNHK